MIDKHMTEAQPGGSGLSLFNSIWQSLLDLVFPPRCTGCGKVDTAWCATCSRVLESIPVVVIKKYLDESLCVASSGLHEGKLRRAIHALKYDNLPTIGEQLAHRLDVVLQQQNWTIDTIIPVPLHTTRLVQRGYNQAQILSELLAQHTGIPCEPESITRQRATQSQVTLTRVERLSNMQEAFVADKAHIADKNVLIVDDVLTTGATLLAVASSLKNADANEIYGLTITTASE